MGNKSSKTKKARSESRPKVTKDEFEKIANLGSGNYASVLLVKKRETNEYYAMKVLNKEYLIAKDEVEHTKTERKILECASHPFLVKMYYAFQTTEHLYIVMSFANGGELFSHLKREKRFNENKARFYAAEIFLGLEYLHEGGVVYRDLKPENVLLDHQGHIVLTDFGLSKILSKDGKTRTFCGTPEYLAPETILNQPHGKPVDWWSFGILLYEMLVGIPPYYSDDVQEMYEKILYSDLYIPDYVSPEATDILAKLLTRPPKHRLGTKDGPSEIKSHPFFRSINWGKLLEKKIRPPYVPNLKGPADISLVDPQFSRQRVNSFPDRPDVNQDQNHAFSGFTFEPSSPGGPTLAARTPDLKNNSAASKSSPTTLPNNTPSPNSHTAQSRERSPNT